MNIEKIGTGDLPENVPRSSPATIIQTIETKRQQRLSSSTKKTRRKIKSRILHANRTLTRLRCIWEDVEEFVRPTLARLEKRLVCSSTTIFPAIVANERCGSWYAYPLQQERQKQQETQREAVGSNHKVKEPSCDLLFHPSCYFKSTDGHAGTWNFSLKRLNLHLISLLHKHNLIVILDASASKALPDSFSRTIPIWASVINRITEMYRKETMRQLQPKQEQNHWDNKLYTPDWLVTPEEHEQMVNILQDRVTSLYSSQAIVKPEWLVSTLVKPLRPYWISASQKEEIESAISTLDLDRYYCILCINCSDIEKSYIPGAADDHESWCRKLSPAFFWDNIHHLLPIVRASTISTTEHKDISPTPSLQTSLEDETDQIIDSIISQDIDYIQNAYLEGRELSSLFDTIGKTNIAIGTRRAGRPPECWAHFSAVLNVTDMEYPEMTATINRSNNYYLQLPVQEGKRDRTELERWLAVGIVFVLHHAENAQNGQKVLIHCAQGKDRSVAVAIAVIQLFCDLKYPLQWSKNASDTDGFATKNLMAFLKTSEVKLSTVETNNSIGENRSGESSLLYQHSGLPTFVVEAMMGRQGRDRLFAWVKQQACADYTGTLASKESLRVALHLIRQDREKAEPTRSTMQKLNRFFMSLGYQ